MARRSSAPAGKGPSQRQLRVGELIRHAIADLLSRGAIHDDVIAGALITVPEVRMTADLKIATVYVMPLGGGNEQEVVKALAANKKFIRAEVARVVNLKYAPDLRFREDASFEEGMRVDALLASEKVRRDVEGN